MGRTSLIQSLREAGLKIMMGHRQVEQAALFYEFSLERHIPAETVLRRCISEGLVGGEGFAVDLMPAQWVPSPSVTTV
jgi:hypothetical protein